MNIKKLGIEVIATSKDKAIEKIKKALSCRITAMSFEKEKLREEIKYQTPNIVIWWCLC